MVGRAGVEENYATPLVCALHARTALHQQDIPAARQELVSARRLRSLLTCALPHLAVQARIELARVHLELARVHLELGHPAGATTLMQEVDELLSCRAGLGNLPGEAKASQARLSQEHGHGVPGAPGLTAAELRLLPMLASHMSFPEIAAQLFLSRHTVKSEAISIYRKLRASSRAQAVRRSRELGLLRGSG